MLKNTFKRLLAYTLTAFLILNSFTGIWIKDIVYAADGSLNAPELLITEILYNPSGIGTSTNDVFEYVELYNSGRVPINLRDYKLMYVVNPSNDANENDITANVIVRPREAVVLWLYTNATADVFGDYGSDYKLNGKTVDIYNEFRKHYGINTEDNVRICTVNAVKRTNSLLFDLINSAYNNSVEAGRKVLIAKDYGSKDNYICKAVYNINVVDTVNDDKSNTYKYQSGSNVMARYETNVNPTPGKVSAPQVPVGTNTNDTLTPVIEHEKPMDSMSKITDLKISAKVTDETVLSYTYLVYETDKTSVLNAVYMAASQSSPDTYEYTIPEAELSGATSLSYYIEAYDGKNFATIPSDINNPLKISLGDAVPPDVTIISPTDGHVFKSFYKPEISALYSDISGIDLQKVKLLLNGQDITSNAAINTSGLTYTPDNDLAPGDYTVSLIVYDNSPLNNYITRTSNFTISDLRPVIPEILITELIPNPSGENDTLDAFEFVELYNSSDHDINLKDYKLMYMTDPAKEEYLTDDITTDAVIKPGEVAVIWLYNQFPAAAYGEYEQWTVDVFEKFKEHYSDQDSDSENYAIYTVKAYNSEGETGRFTLHNSGIKTLLIAKDDAAGGEFICRATYDGSVDTKLQDTSAIYKYPINDSIEMEIIGRNVTPTPGRITYVQKPINYDDPKAPVINHIKPFDSMMEGDLKITATVKDETELRYVKLYYETYRTTGIKAVDMLLSQLDTYEYTIPESEIAGSSNVKYYIEVSDGLHTVTNPALKSKPYVIALVDGIGPRISIVNPAPNNNYVNYYRPVIKAILSDASGIDKGSAKIYLNGQDVTAKAQISDTSITLTPDADLADGKYIVKLEIYDNSTLKNKSTREWIFTITTTGETADYKVPELLITEVIANPTADFDSSNKLNRNNVYEFLELYNASNKDINLRDYKLLYIPDLDNPSDIKTNDIYEDIILYPGQAIVVWIYNDKSKANFGTKDSSAIDINLKKELISEFKAHYNMDDGLNVTMVDGDSVNSSTAFNLDNTNAKTIMVAKDSAAPGEYICTADYNDDPDLNYDMLDKSVTYKYPADNTIKMAVLRPGMDPTPGKTLYGQIPPNYFDKSAPVIIHNQPVSSMTPGDLEISANVVDETQLQSVKLYYETFNTNGMIVKEMLESQEASGEFKAVIPLSDILGSNFIKYYIEAGDGIHNVILPGQKSDPFSISVTDTQGPKVKNMKPSDKFYVENNYRPVISAEFSDASGIDMQSVKLFVDDKDVTHEAVVTNSDISYTPAIDLDEGDRTVRIELGDLSETKNTTVKSWSFRVGPEVYNFYKGQIHSHSNYSDGMGNAEEAYVYARDKSNTDFFGLTDHANFLDDKEWKELNTIAEKFYNPDNFVTIPGFELTWDSSMGWWGHMNSYNTGWLEPKRNNTSVNLPNYYDHLAATPESISQFNHPGYLWGDFAEYGYYSREADEVIDLMEVKTLEHEADYAKALDKGWHISPTNNEDNHSGNWAKSLNSTVILAPRLTRENLLDAINKNRTYAAQDKNLQIIYKINDKIMGSTLDKPQKLSVSIEAKHPSMNIGNITVFADGHSIAASKTFETNNVKWSFELPAEYSYYYVRIVLPNNAIAVTAPIWVDNVRPLELSDLDVGTDKADAKNPVQINAKLKNIGTDPVKDVKVEYFRTNTLIDNKIGEQSIGTVNPGTEYKILNNIPFVSLDRTIYVKVTGYIGESTVTAVKSINVPELLITEIMPMTSKGVGDNSAFEFIEIYNNSNNNIDLADYRIESFTGSGKTVDTWDFNESKLIKPYEILVIWLKPSNSIAAAMTINDFNSRYGTNLTNEQILVYNGRTLDDTGGKTLFISHDSPLVKLSQVRYNVNLDLTNDVAEDLSIQYKYPVDGTDIVKKLASKQIPTPGFVSSDQVPYIVVPTPDEQEEIPEETGNTEEAGNVEETVIEQKPEIVTRVVTVNISENEFNSILSKAITDENGNRILEFEIPAISSANTYIQKLPAAALAKLDKDHLIRLTTDLATMTIPGNMFDSREYSEAKEIAISLKEADRKGLPTNIADDLGARPIIELQITVDGKRLELINSDIIIQVSVPYAPTTYEAKNHEHIVIWNIDADGKVIPVTNSKYDPSEGLIKFTTNRYGQFAVNYVEKTFSDLTNVEWARESIEVMASKGIINGTGENTFNPDDNITRADFTLLLIKALGLTAKIDSNFSDIDKSDYYYEAVGIAKALGITKGQENGKFNPDEHISRQDMMVLIARALKLSDKSDVNIESFTDRSQIALYAEGYIKALIEAGLIKGYNNKINPNDNTTRAETAVLIYRIYNK